MKILVPVLRFLLIPAVCLAFLPGCLKLKPPESKGPATVSEVSTATSVTAEGQPLSVSSSFLASTPVIYVTARVTGAPEDTIIGARCTYVKDDAGRSLNQQVSENSMEVTGTKYVSFSLQSPGGAWGSGQYTAAILVNGSEVANTHFTVQPVQKADVPAPTILFFKAVPEAISIGQSVTLSWNVTGATSVQVSTIGNVSPSGSVIVNPTNSVEYELVASNSAGSTSMKLNITVTSFYTDKPELVVTDFRVQGSRAYCKVKNIGGVFSRANTVFLYIEGNNRASSQCEVLSPGEEREISFPNFEWTYGTARTFKLPVRVCADGLNIIGEYDENNNCLVTDW